MEQTTETKLATVTTADGREIVRKPLTLDKVTRAVRKDDGTGFCIACGNSQKFVEPDAERYPCTRCKHLKVFGAEQILLRVQA